MKNLFMLIMLILVATLAACNKTEKNTQTKSTNNTSDPVPQTITQKEVSRIALLEAKQFLFNASKQRKVDMKNASETYNEAQKLYNNGHYKQAQKLAVQVRHQVEGLMSK